MTSQAPPPYRHDNPMAPPRGPRYANIVLGAWLFLSAFAWPHRDASFTNSWLAGVLIVAFSVGSLAAPALRWANVLVALWLMLTTVFLWPSTPTTVWNNVIVGLLVFMLSAVTIPGSRAGGAGTRPV